MGLLPAGLSLDGYVNRPVFGGGPMNKQSPPKGIEWTRIRAFVDGTLTELDGYTWNPISGCMMGCQWVMPDGSVASCYAKAIAEGVAKDYYPQGFEHIYFNEKELEAPLKRKTPLGIFAGSMTDLYQSLVTDDQREAVHSIIRQASWHTFQTLTKVPETLTRYSPFPANQWVGVSSPSGRSKSTTFAASSLRRTLGILGQIEAPVRFMSIEPLWFDMSPTFRQWLDANGRLPLEWVIIGAASNGPRTYQPRAEWVSQLLTVFDRAAIPVFFKGNLDWPIPHHNFPDWHVSSPSQPKQTQPSLLG